MQYRVSDVVIRLYARGGVVDRQRPTGTNTRTPHSSSSVQTFTPSLLMSSCRKNVSDGLVAATCTETSLY